MAEKIEKVSCCTLLTAPAPILPFPGLACVFVETAGANPESVAAISKKRFGIRFDNALCAHSADRVHVSGMLKIVKEIP